MLSLDFTDRQIKLVRGSLSGSKVRIIQVETIDLPEGFVENGFVVDVPMLASELLEFLQTKDIKEKDVIIEIGSGLILHKELILPKPKSMKNSFVIETMIQSSMNITAEYNISFNVLGETEDENKNPMIQVMATAVPQRLVDGYARLFQHLGLNLKSIFVSTNCISRLVESSQKLMALMPMMMIQVEPDFVNTSFYDEGRLILSRRITVEAMDESESESDAIVRTVYDNVFRMFQFINSRSDAKPLKQLIFYGNIPDFIILTNAMSSFNTPTQVLNAPGNIVSFTEFEFAEFANAISAFCKPKHEYDRIDLLQASSAKEKKAKDSYGLILPLILILTLAITAGAYFFIQNINNNIRSQITSVQAQTSELSVRATVLQQKIDRLNEIEEYSLNSSLANYLFRWQPTIVTEILDKLEEPLLDGMSIIESVQISGYSVTATFECDSDESPSQYVRALVEQGYFENIIYSGYTGAVTAADNAAGGETSATAQADKYTFTLSMLLKGGNAYEAE